jgi:hypothetical protein
MIERAGVDVHTRDSFAPRAADRFGEEPPAVTLT